MIETHPIQKPHSRERARIPAVVTRAAYEVYEHVWAPQPAMIQGDCRGGFGLNELVAFLYARSFPKDQWRQRFNEAVDGMEGMK